MSAEGSSIGRTGTVCLVAVGCIKATYIFDLHQLGEESISIGLKSFFENGNILKVNRPNTASIQQNVSLSDVSYLT